MTSESGDTNGKAVEIQLAAATLLGDVRDAVLAEFKTAEKPWSKMSEEEQERLIQRADDIADQVVLGAVAVVAQHGFSNLPASIDQFTRKDGLKIVLKAGATVEHITKLAEHGNNSVVLVLAEPARFMGERAPAETENVGELAIPKTGPGAPSDPKATAKLGRGNGKQKPPTADLPTTDTSAQPFAPANA